MEDAIVAPHTANNLVEVRAVSVGNENLPETLATIPIDRVVVETDAPYMAPVPMRGQRNESAFARFVLQRMAQCYGVSEERMAQVTNENVRRVFGDE